MSIERALLFARTAAHLRPAQILDRPLRGLRRRIPVAMPRSVPALRPECGEVTRKWLAYRPEVAAAVMSGEFTFLNHSERFSKVPWRERVRSHLWTYKLHYFAWGADLAGAYAKTGDRRFIDRFVDLAIDWIDATKDRQGDGWDPYPTAVRIQSWIRTLHLAGENGIPTGCGARILQSLSQQVRHLEFNLEYHLLGNHLQKDFAALALAAVCAPQWSRASAERALSRFWASLDDHFLPDGCHAERSPMYHATALADFLEVGACARAAGFAVPSSVGERLGHACAALRTLSRANGSLRLLNDSAVGEAPTAAEIAALRDLALERRELAEAPSELRDAGYVVLEAGEDQVMFDCGELGPAHQPGHAHCDVLSFEWDHRGVQVIADSGCSGYDDPSRRAYERSTAAHNTVRIGSRDQAELWDTFRVARRPFVGRAALFDGRSLSGTVSPYWDHAAVHARVVNHLAAGVLEVRDEVRQSGSEATTGFLHLTPDWSVRVDGTRAFATRSGRGPSLSLAMEFEGAAKVRLGVGAGADGLQGWHAERFGEAVPAPVVAYDFPPGVGSGVQSVRTLLTIHGSQ